MPIDRYITKLFEVKKGAADETCHTIKENTIIQRMVIVLSNFKYSHYFQIKPITCRQASLEAGSNDCAPLQVSKPLAS